MRTRYRTSLRSGMFLAAMQQLLEGEHGFYDNIFRDLGIPARPWKWEADQAAAPMVNSDPMKQAGIARLIDAWRECGHLVADIDPLGMVRDPHPDLEPASHGLTIWDLDRTFHCGPFGVITLRSLMDRLRTVYAGKYGVEFLRAFIAFKRHFGAGTGHSRRAATYAVYHQQDRTLLIFKCLFYVFRRLERLKPEVGQVGRHWRNKRYWIHIIFLFYL